MISTKKINVLILAVASLAFSACQKTENQATGQETETDESFYSQVDALFEQDILGGTESEDLYLVNEGIPQILDEEPFAPALPEISGQQGCRAVVRPDSVQQRKLHHAWKNYLDCRRGHSDSIRKHYRFVRLHATAKRQELVSDLRAGNINPTQFSDAMQDLRKFFRSQLHKRCTLHHRATLLCYKNYLAQVKSILNPAQWQKFVQYHSPRLPLPPHKR